MSNLEAFREETSTWLEANCPQEMRNRTFHWEDAHEVYDTDAGREWLKLMAERGWTAPTWPKEYGGGGLEAEEAGIIAQEMGRIKAIPALTGMGLSMI